jgi:hypothetical protein
MYRSLRMLYSPHNIKFKPVDTVLRTVFVGAAPITVSGNWRITFEFDEGNAYRHNMGIKPWLRQSDPPPAATRRLCWCYASQRLHGDV